MAERLSAGDLSYLRAASLEADPQNNSYLNLVLHIGDEVPDPAYLTVTLKTLKPLKKKKEHVSKTLLTNMLLPRSEALLISARYGGS
jgi:hypothetical protein